MKTLILVVVIFLGFGFTAKDALKIANDCQYHFNYIKKQAMKGEVFAEFIHLRKECVKKLREKGFNVIDGSCRDAGSNYCFSSKYSSVWWDKNE